MLEDTLAELLRHMPLRTQAAETTQERIVDTRDIAIFALAWYSMLRGFDLTYTIASQILRLPDAKGFIFNISFGKTLRASSEAVVVLAASSQDIQDTCAARAIGEYISAAQGIGWNLSWGYLFSAPAPDGSRTPSLIARDMTKALQTY